MHTCPTTVALVSLMLPSQHHARILLIGKCFRPAAHAAFRRIQRQTLPTQLREDPLLLRYYYRIIKIRSTVHGGDAATRLTMSSSFFGCSPPGYAASVVFARTW